MSDKAKESEAREAREAPRLTYCGICEGPLIPLGILGTREHFRCDHCGMDYQCVIKGES